MKSFTEIVVTLENWLKSKSIIFELLELRTTPYSFGSGFFVHRIDGRNVKVVFDGRDNIVSLYVSPKHDKYPSNNWELRFEGNTDKYKELDFSRVL